MKPAFALLIALSSAPANALLADESPGAGKQTAQSLQAKTDVSLNYLLYLPADYGKQDQWPLLIFLHGSGERGDDLSLVKTHGPPKLIESGRRFPFIVVSPQCPAYQRWQPAVLSALLDDLEGRLKIDRSRIYLTV